MAMARTAIRNICSLSPPDPGTVLTKANKTLSEDNDSSMFVTVVLAFYEIDTGKLSYANAGHLYPIVYCNDNPIKELAAEVYPAIGVLDDIEYPSFTQTLLKDETLIIFTDGVTEAVDEKGNFYGDEGIQNYIKENQKISNSEFLTKLFDELVQFQKNKIADDITVFLITRKT